MTKNSHYVCQVTCRCPAQLAVILMPKIEGAFMSTNCSNNHILRVGNCVHFIFVLVFTKICINLNYFPQLFYIQTHTSVPAIKIVPNRLVVDTFALRAGGGKLTNAGSKLDKFTLIIYALIQPVLTAEKCLLINQKYTLTNT